MRQRERERDIFIHLFTSHMFSALRLGQVKVRRKKLSVHSSKVGDRDPNTCTIIYSLPGCI